MVLTNKYGIKIRGKKVKPLSKRNWTDVVARLGKARGKERKLTSPPGAVPVDGRGRSGT